MPHNPQHPTLQWLAELGTGPLQPHTDVIDKSEIAPVTDIDEGREDRWETRESLMSELGLRERDFR